MYRLDPGRQVGRLFFVDEEDGEAARATLGQPCGDVQRGATARGKIGIGVDDGHENVLALEAGAAGVVVGGGSPRDGVQAVICERESGFLGSMGIMLYDIPHRDKFTASRVRLGRDRFFVVTGHAIDDREGQADTDSLKTDISMLTISSKRYKLGTIWVPEA